MADVVTAQPVTVVSDVSAFLHKHIIMMWCGFAFVIALFIGMFAYVVHSANVRADQADAKTTLFMQQEAQQQKDFLAAQQKITQDTQQQQAIVHIVQDRTNTAVQTVQQVTAPTNTTSQVAEDSQKYLGVTPVSETDGSLGYNKPDVQQFIANKVNLDTVTANLNDTQTQLTLEQDKFNTVSQQLTTSEATTDSCKVALDSSNKALVAAKRKSKFLSVGWYFAGFASGFGIRVITHP